MNAIITGASRGIGKAVSEIFAIHGYNLLLCSKNEENLFQTIEELKTKYPKVSIDGKAFDMGKKDEARLFGESVCPQNALL